ncbi:hypothetical protein H2199_007565 [Coniosporium tulheliwenetii]|uniref:Uncharacterized protein n=1 Tax=Coniosporium tulheliwenetii TaxID=3383036 RepID=A0ACC2YPT4_9PEZI|nr:hypothetical protein H2199_007565 [Cladosporium sp. JES 115]
MAMAVNTSAPPTLLTIPGEIRNKIHNLVLNLTPGPPKPANLYIVRRKFRTRGGRRVYLDTQHPPPPPLGQVNRQLRHEVLSLYYSAYEWHIDLPRQQELFNDWITNVVGEALVFWVQKLIIRVTDQAYKGFAGRGSCLAYKPYVEIRQTEVALFLAPHHMGDRVVLRRAGGGDERAVQRAWSMLYGVSTSLRTEKRWLGRDLARYSESQKRFTRSERVTVLEHS